MLRISTWDELDHQWATCELNLPPDTRDPKLINDTFGKLVTEDDEGDGWEVDSHSFTGPILTIEARSYTNKLCILIINYEDQE